ncbi:unnamed protein product [Leptosia nina]|uniref:Uncharacterized protein n=1 Tax=Leptosia nina TaxID=320188 RepID=A0AAV1JGY8_9NEOP
MLSGAGEARARHGGLLVTAVRPVRASAARAARHWPAHRPPPSPLRAQARTAYTTRTAFLPLTVNRTSPPDLTQHSRRSKVYLSTRAYQLKQGHVVHSF